MTRSTWEEYVQGLADEIEPLIWRYEAEFFWFVMSVGLITWVQLYLAFLMP
jgi:hypothetical protein